jgi:serine/threonine protein kinase
VALAPNYYRFTQGSWNFAVLPDYWSRELQELVLQVVEGALPSKHPQTVSFRQPGPKHGEVVYLKIFHGFRSIVNLKDLFRDSKAFHSLRQSVALARAGFDAPTIIGAGEARRFRWLLRAFIVSTAIPGQPLPLFLHDCYSQGSSGLSLSKKRDSLRRLAEQVRRLHSLGFVHGDLVPSNICVSQTERGGDRFFFMDNDRTRRYPSRLPQTLWKRNLVQLNRLPLPGISLQDRMRFFRWYRGDRELRAADRKLLRWLEMKTRQRRKEIDAVDATIDFRKLMRWEKNTARSF